MKIRREYTEGIQMREVKNKNSAALVFNVLDCRYVPPTKVQFTFFRQQIVLVNAVNPQFKMANTERK